MNPLTWDYCISVNLLLHCKSTTVATEPVSEQRLTLDQSHSQTYIAFVIRVYSLWFFFLLIVWVRKAWNACVSLSIIKFNNCDLWFSFSEFRYQIVIYAQYIHKLFSTILSQLNICIPFSYRFPSLHSLCTWIMITVLILHTKEVLSTHSALADLFSIPEDYDKFSFPPGQNGKSSINDISY